VKPIGDLEPEIGQRPLPEEVEELRAAYLATLPALDEVFLPRIDGHILALDQAIHRLTDLHAAVIDRSDIDLAAETRWAALWELSGRCLALANLLLAELRLGYTAETVGTIRVLDEAYHLLHAVAADNEGELTRRWLRGETVMPRDARAVMDAEQVEVGRALAEQGVELAGDVADLAGEIYGPLSKGAHNARPGFKESFSRPLRQFNYGPHPDPRQRAVYVDYASELIEGVVISVGSALARFFGGDWYRETIPPMQQELEAIRQALPIDAAARAEYGF
jgi:hypothetical protein